MHKQGFKKVKITVNGKELEVASSLSIFDAVNNNTEYKIPGLCHATGKEPCDQPGSCRTCMAEINGRTGITCKKEVEDGMVINTNTNPALEKQRGVTIDLINERHPGNCLICAVNGNCTLQRLAQQYHASSPKAGLGCPVHDTSSPSIIRYPELCIDCGKCIIACNSIQSVGALSRIGRGINRYVGTPLGKTLSQTDCVNCGQCILACPVGAISEVLHIDEVEEALIDPAKHVVVQVAPSVRVALAEEFGLEPGIPQTGKMYAALRRLRFDRVFDTNFAADLTIMEEAHELVQRVTEGTNLPLITSCCPGHVLNMEHKYPDLLGHLSSCKSPQQMFGAMVKTYYAQQSGIDPKDIVSVSVMPCTAKKYEAQRPEMNASGYQDVDYVLTTRELVQILRTKGIDFAKLPEETADSLLGEYTGAGTIFGVTGGVMEAAIRSVYPLVTGNELVDIDFKAVRGMAGIKEAVVNLGDREVKVAVANGLAHANTLLDQIRSGSSPYVAIEIMACPGGCIGGGGQPKSFDPQRVQQRAEGLYKDDKKIAQKRRAHENGEVKKLYEIYLEKPASPISHSLLHTEFIDKSIKL